MPSEGSQKDAPDERPIAWPIRYEGTDVYEKAFPGTGFGVVFEDEGDTGYLYVTDEGSGRILDALHLYDQRDPHCLRKGDEIYFVWNPTLLKAGLFYHERFQAIVDFQNRMACCRTGFPPPSEWCRSRHDWKEDMTRGLL